MKLLKDMLRTQDMSEKQAESIYEDAIKNELRDEDIDPVTAIIVTACLTADNTDIYDIETDLDYAITQLQKAKQALR